MRLLRTLAADGKLPDVALKCDINSNGNEKVTHPPHHTRRGTAVAGASNHHHVCVAHTERWFVVHSFFHRCYAGPQALSDRGHGKAH